MTASLFDLPEFEPLPGMESLGPARPAPVTRLVSEPEPEVEPGARPAAEAVERTPAPPDDGRSTAHSVTFVHTADWQIGMTRHYLDAEAAHSYAAARREAITRIGAVARETGAEFIVVSGDVFEDHRVADRTIRQTMDVLAACGVPVYLLPGNHDTADPASVYRSRAFVDACPANVTVLSADGVVRVREGIELVPAPWAHKHPLTDLVNKQIERAGGNEHGVIRIVVGHGGVDTIVPGDDPALISVDALERAVESGLVDYVALGDRHSVTDVGGGGRIWYSGAHEVTNFDHIEAEPGHVLAVTLRRAGDRRDIEVTPHRVGEWSFRSISRDIAGADDVEALRAELEAIADKTRVVVQLGLVGSLTIAENAVLEEMLEQFRDRFAALVPWTKNDDLTVVGAESDIESLGVAGYAAEAAHELLGIADSSDDESAQAARDALALLRRLASR
ncbi:MULTISPECIES: metallophosphoesterase family protein [Gordonia]|uniref:Nuclease SbcCD subunit D n=1 Tax=Gordonia pseudamarae TaxID=2831662 RepID=A0ABX6IG37_9ACTN|nr:MULTISPECIES: metallophosphoesterase [Gordonia]QHN34819.1 exonuclease SbcCD subunit D [Gordonia pseudamarae]